MPERMVVARSRRWPISAALSLLLLLVLGIAAWSAAGAGTGPRRAASYQPPVRAYHGRYTTAAAIPVIVYHELNNGCRPAAATCRSRDPESVSTAQFTTEMAWLVRAGYHTVTMAQYLAWLGNGRTLLPARPILITADNGIFAFLNGVQEILARDGFTATAALVTGFADAAGGQCQPKIGAREVQPGCPESSEYWDATWTQLKNLDPHVWSFILEAGRSGHYVQDYDWRCRVFDTCMMPGETSVQYQARVASELDAGLAALDRGLPGQAGVQAWVVPYSDLGYKRCKQADCTPQPSDGPRRWLVSYAASRFAAVFVEDADRNGTGHERFRFDVNGRDTLTYFQKALAGFVRAGDFNRER
jgi:hypothetical protein